MERFQGAVSLVTGGASGIGRALCERLASAGAEVVVADVRAVEAEATARAITAAGGRARAAALDVRDAAAFRALVDDTVARAGRLDYLFNNAGITINGEARDLTLDDWRAIVDVNLNGVVHGVTAAYPVMLRQGHGHIVNTASMAGLAPAPGIVPYAATKHAVVGLSVSLRAEAADLGVKVSAVCPGFIDTPIIHASRYVKLDRRRLLDEMLFTPMRADDCAREILDGVRRNRGIIVVTLHGRVYWWLMRLSPRLALWLATTAVRRMRRRFRQE